MSRMMMKEKTMIDFELKFDELVSEIEGNQKKMDVNSILGVFYGLSKEGLPRLAFSSSSASPKLKSTKVLRVEQGWESPLVYWTCFDLLQPDAKKAFCAFCSNLTEAIEGFVDEYSAFLALKRRYAIWKMMFRNNSEKVISPEKIQGLFGELYFLKNHLLHNCTPSEAIRAWGGGDGNSKDFAIQSTWYEIKTVGANSTEVKISSLTQLESEDEGHLVVIKVEKMSEQFEKNDASVGNLISSIISCIDDEEIEEAFSTKLNNYGLNSSCDCFSDKFDVKSVKQYKVDEKFPRLTSKNVPYKEICRAEYSLSIGMLNSYLEE